MSKEEKRAKENQSDLSSESSGKGRDDDSEEKDSFIVSDDEEDDYSDSYPRRRRLPDDDDYESKEEKKKKKKKDKKKKDKKKKKKKRYNSDEDYDDNDLVLIDENEENNLKRLKKKKVQRAIEDDDDYDMEEEIGPEEEEMQEGDYAGYRQGYDSEEQYSRPNEIVQKVNDADLQELIDPKILNQFYEQPKDKEIVDIDLPQRQILRYRPYAKMQKLQLEDIKAKFQEQDRKTEAKWIFDKLKQQNHNNFQNFEQKDCLKKIENVLNAMNKEHLQIMYIYYYRKKIWADQLNLNLLLKIEEIDQEWLSFKKDYQQLKKDFEEVIPSFIEVPKSLEDAFNSCTDTRLLKYFKQYTHFVLTKHRQPQQSKTNSKSINMTRQMVGCGLLEQIQKMGVFLPPQYLCLNFRNRIQEKKPKTPHMQPDKAFRKILKERFMGSEEDNRKMTRQEAQEEEERRDYQYDWSSMPLIAPEKRIRTACTYLSLELFNYPQLRKLLKEKYYKKLVISTTPTTKGQQNINLYSSYFPVKRIKEKPVVSLDKQVWILALEAEKMGLITIQLKFQWELSAQDKKNLQSDTVYLELVKYYFDVSSHQSGEVWNVFRKQVLIKMLTDYFIPSFMQEVREDLTRDGHKRIIQLACQKFKGQLNKGPSLKEGKPIKILAMVLEKDKLGMAFVDEHGIDHFPLCMQIFTDEDLKRFASQSVLDKYIGQHQPDMILISANCRRAQTLRKQLRNPSLFPEPIYCAFGQYQVPNLMANKKKMQGITTQKTILEAISMARMKKNPMAEILGLWSDSIEENGILSMNLHPLQRCVSKRKLLDALEKVAIEIVNQVGLDINELLQAEHCRNQLQFICGLGPRKAFDLLNRIKNDSGINSRVHFRKDLVNMCSGEVVYKNCSPFLKIITPEHNEIIERYDRDRRKSSEHGIKFDQSLINEINLLDMTRIPEQWYSITSKLFVQAILTQNMVQLKAKKSIKNLPEATLATLQMFKKPQKLRNVEWQARKQANSPSMQYYDENLVKVEIMHRFKDTRDPEKVMENRDIFYSLLRETPQTLRKYMVFTAKILSVHNQALNVVIQQNGLFGNIKIHDNKPEYEKGNFIKAIITGFPFDEGRKNNRFEDDQQLLKVEMSLNFPHKTDDRNHDCMATCFPSIVKQIHPNIDLYKDNFDLRKEDKPVIEVKEENVSRPRNQTRRISHAKFKNIAMATAVDEVRNMPVGEFLFRPSTQGPDFLTITWHFYKNIVTHIKLRSEQKNMSNTNCVYRILDKDRDKTYNTIDEVIDKHIKPMNALVQDVISNKKFMPNPIQQIDEKIRSDVSRDSSYIHYYFCCSPDYPQFFILMYIYKEKRPVKQLIRVRSSGLYFHQNMFQSLRELITWFKEHLKDREYQKYARNTCIKK